MKTKAKDGSKRVGLWIRVSTEQQAKTDSPEHHEARGRAYADFRQWKVVEVYHLEGTSGKSVIEHPEALRMFQDIKRGHITGLIFSKLARLGRNTKELLTIADRFQEHNADLISLEESIDTSSPSGRFFFTLLSAMAEWERSEIGSRVAASIPIRAKLGKQTGGVAPFGYKWVNNHIEIDEKEAPVRKLAHELFIKHKRKKTVARLLNEQGYRMRKGGKFTDTTLDRLLRDPVVKGLRRANYTTQIGSNGWKHKPEDQWVFVDAPAIISKELWDSCQQVLDEITGSRKKVGRLGVHLFSTVTYCTCGMKMYMRTNSPKYVCTSCKNKIDPDDLEAIFHSRLENFQFSDADIQNHLSKQRSILNEKKHLLETQKEECQKLKTKIDGAFDLFHSGQLKKESFSDYHTPLYESLKQKEETILNLQKEIDMLGIQVFDDDQVLEDTRNLYNMWGSFSKEDKKTIINTIVSSIIVDKEEVTINLSHLPSIMNEPNNKNKNGTHTPLESIKLSNASLEIWRH